MTAIDRHAIKLAEALAAAQPRCDLPIPALPPLPPPITATDLTFIDRAGETYSVPVIDFASLPTTKPTYDQVIERTPGVIHYWPLNEPAGSLHALDHVGSFTLTAFGNVSFGAPPVCNDLETVARWPGEPVGLPDPSLNAADYIVLQAALIPQAGPWSIEFIASQTFLGGANQDNQVMLCIGGYPATTGFYVATSGGGDYIFGGPSGDFNTDANAITAGTSHIVLTYDGVGTASNSVKGYINGWPLMSQPESTFGTLTPEVFGYIGLRQDSEYGLIGTIGKLAIYDVVLPYETVLNHYNSGVNQ